LPESFLDFEVEFDISLELAIAFHTVLNFGHVSFAFSQQPIKEPTYDTPLHLSENVGPHVSSNFPIVGKGLNTFLSYSWKCRVGASDPEAKNSTSEKREGKGWKNQ